MNGERDTGALQQLRARPRADHDLRPGRDRRSVCRHGVPDRAAKLRHVPLPPRHNDPFELDRSSRGDGLVQRVDPAEQRAELEAAEDLLQRRAVGRARHQICRIDAEREVAAHRCQLLRCSRLLGVLANVLRTRRRQLIDVFEHSLQRAVLSDQLPSGLVADPRNSRNVVRRVSFEADEIGYLVGSHAVPGLDALRGVDVDVGDAAWGHHQRHVLGAELKGVAIGRHDAGLDPGLIGAGGERGDDIVGLQPSNSRLRYPKASTMGRK